ncbi:MAG: class I SAM-dependent methyltransferase [Anaerolineaceae bacterium]|jgi:ubiquinone/menaquinone biosynthesis C-methylase UbiE|nr:MAG: class I SAM-dependent methyltransferase [Anaerolineaceae bacterium]
MSLDERFRSEKAKWDEISKRQAQEVEIFPSGMDFHEFARQDAEFPGVSEFLGDLRGARVLELGCGAGVMAVLLAKAGAHVTAFDLSSESVRLTRHRASLNHVELEPLVSAGEFLPFASESFDVIIGKSILHHLVIEIGRRDLYRVLRKGGKAVFVEPLGMNPILTFARKYIPYPHKAVVGVDRPLTYDDMRAWNTEASEWQAQEIQFLSMLERAFGWDTRFEFLRKTDRFLLKNVPFLRRFCRYAVILSKK